MAVSAVCPATGGVVEPLYFRPVMAAFSVLKKIHWSDADPAGIAWFPNFFRWFDDAEEELYAAALGRPREQAFAAHGAGIPRVAAHIDFEAPVQMGMRLRIAIDVRLEHSRRLRYAFEMFDTSSGIRLAHGYVRVACVALDTFTPRDFPEFVTTFVERIHALGAEQATPGVELPWV